MANQPVEHEKLLAFVDGTLDAEEAEALSQRMGNDEELRRHVAALIENRHAQTPPPFPGEAAASEAPPAAAEAPKKPWQRVLASMKGQSKEQNRLAAFAVGSLVAAACAGLVFLLYLDNHIKVAEPPPQAASQEAAPPPPEAPPAEPAPEGGAPQTGTATAAETAPPIDAAPAEAVNAAAPPANAAEAAAAPETAPPQSVEAAAPAAEPAPEPKAAAPAPAAETAAPAPAKVAVPAGGRFAVLAKTCAVHEEPQEDSKTINQLNEGSRLWTEPAAEGWKKVYRKKGVAYVQEDCFR